MSARTTFWLLTVSALSLGCNPSGEQAKEPTIPKGNPSFVRVVNLSGKEIVFDIGNTYRNLSLGHGEMSTARSVSGGKKTKVTLDPSGKAITLDLATAARGFTTVIVGKDGMKSFISGDGISSAAVGKIDLVNLTSKPLEFSIQSGAKEVIDPQSSKTVEVSFGDFNVSAKGTSDFKVTTGKAQVWAVFAYPDGNSVQIGGTNLKGTGVAVGTGGPS